MKPGTMEVLGDNLCTYWDGSAELASEARAGRARRDFSRSSRLVELPDRQMSLKNYVVRSWASKDYRQCPSTR